MELLYFCARYACALICSKHCKRTRLGIGAIQASTLVVLNERSIKDAGIGLSLRLQFCSNEQFYLTFKGTFE